MTAIILASNNGIDLGIKRLKTRILTTNNENFRDFRQSNYPFEYVPDKNKGPEEQDYNHDVHYLLFCEKGWLAYFRLSGERNHAGQINQNTGFREKLRKVF
jgi:hypothetical protein